MSALKKTYFIFLFLIVSFAGLFAPPYKYPNSFMPYLVPPPYTYSVDFNLPSLLKLKKAEDEIVQMRKWLAEYSIIPVQYRKIVIHLNEEKKIGLPVQLIYNIVAYESAWYEHATNRNLNGSYDFGLMQLNSYYVDQFAKAYYTGDKPFNPYNPEMNLEVGLKHFKWLVTYYNGDYFLSLQAYNAGRGRVDYGRVPKQSVKYATHIMVYSGMGKEI